MNDEVTDNAAWTVSSGDLLVNYKLLLVDSWVTSCPLDEIQRADFLAFVIPNDNFVSECGLNGV